MRTPSNVTIAAIPKVACPLRAKFDAAPVFVGEGATDVDVTVDDDELRTYLNESYLSNIEIDIYDGATAELLPEKVSDTAVFAQL